MNFPKRPRPLLLLALALLSPAFSRAQDVVGISFNRYGDYVQLSDAAPEPNLSPDGEDAFSVLAVMELSADFLSDPDNLLFVRAVTLQPPSPGQLRGMDFLDGAGLFTYFDSFASAAVLESEFRNGNYQFTFDTVITGPQVTRMTVADRALPEAPRIVNFDAVQQVDPAQAFTVEWTPEVPAGEVSMWVYVYDVETDSEVLALGPFGPGTTLADIPAQSLGASKTYRLELEVARLDFNDPDSVPTRRAISDVVTAAPLKTTGGGGGGDLSIATLQPGADGSLQVVVNCQTGIPLRLQRSATPGGPWQTVDAVTPQSTPATFTVAGSVVGDLSFFRAEQ